MGIQDEGQVEEAFLRGDVRDVRNPDPAYLRGREVPFHEILDQRSLAPAGGPFPTAAHAALQPGLPHESLNPFTATPSPKRAQLGMDPWRAVGLPASSMDLVNLGGEVASSQLRFDGDLDLQA